MGHIRLGRIPGTRKWQEVVSLISEGADVPQIAAKSADAAARGLETAAHDKALVHAFWLLTQIPQAARQANFAERLRALGLEVSSEPTLLDVVGAFASAVDRRVRETGGRTDLGETAQHAAAETLTFLAGRELPSLFAPSPSDVQHAIAKLGTSDRFSIVARDFFSRLTRRYLAYFLSRELSNHVGPQQRFASTGDHTKFNVALDLHCREASRIIKEFPGAGTAKPSLSRAALARRKPRISLT
ncbi:MAG: hypothetical protein H0T75_13695 [Rhizobiales bacterium]|nr:hypothetical protein [Hyphomicrobiales bacterium]